MRPLARRLPRVLLWQAQSLERALSVRVFRILVEGGLIVCARAILGTLAQLLEAPRDVSISEVIREPYGGGYRTRYQPVEGTEARVEVVSEGFEMRIVDAGLVTALRRDRPATVTFHFYPCTTDPDDPELRCPPDRTIRVAYP